MTKTAIIKWKRGNKWNIQIATSISKSFEVLFYPILTKMNVYFYCSMCWKVANGFRIKDNILIQKGAGGTEHHLLQLILKLESRCSLIIGWSSQRWWPTQWECLSAGISDPYEPNQKPGFTLNGCSDLICCLQFRITVMCPCERVQVKWTRIFSFFRRRFTVTEATLIHELWRVNATEKHWWASADLLLLELTMLPWIAVEIRNSVC